MNEKSSIKADGGIALNEIYGDVRNLTRIFYFFLTLLLAGIVIGIIVLQTTRSTTASLLLASGVLPALVAYYLVKQQKFEFAATFIAVFLILINVAISTNGLGIHSINNLAFPIVLIFSSLVINPRLMVMLTSLCVLGIAWLVFGELNGWYTPGVLVHSVPGDFVSASVVIVITAIMTHRLTSSLFRGFSLLHNEIQDRKKLGETLHQREAILESVTFAAEQFLKTPDWRENIGVVLEKLGSTIHASHAYIFERHPGLNDELVSSMRYEWTAPGQKSELGNPDFQNATIAWDDFEEYYQTLNSGKPFVGNSQTFRPVELKYFSSIGIKAILEMPLFVNGRYWGTIGFDDYENERDWRNAEVDALKIAAGILGAAIQREEADSAARESERIYRQAIEAAGAVPYYRDHVNDRYLFMGKGIENITGYKPGEVGSDLWDEIIQEVIPLGETAGMSTQDAIQYARSGKVKEWKADIRIRSRNHGERWLSDSAIELFNESETSYASIGILQDVTERKLTEFNLRKHESLMEAVTFSAEQFLKSTDWRLNIETVLERLGREFKVSHAYLFENHERPDGVFISSIIHEWTAPGVASDMDNPEFHDRPIRSEGVDRLDDILDRGEPLVGSTSMFTADEQKYIDSIGLKALLEIRIIVNGNHWGTLGVDEVEQVREWSAMEVDVIRIAAGVLGAAIERQLIDDVLKTELIERQRLINELERRNAESETLRETTEIITSTLNISEAVRQILQQLQRVVRYDSASVWLFKDNMAHQIGADGLPKDATTVTKHFINKDEPDYPLWAENSPYVILSDIQEKYEKFRNPPLSYIHGWLAIPLKVRGNFTGFIALDGREVGQFSEHDAHLALNYANQVSIALENARLFSDLQLELNERKKLINELENKNSELERFTYTVSHDLKSPLVTIDGFLRYIERDVETGNIERFRTDMDRVKSAVSKMQRLLMELLELSRVGRMMNESVVIPFEDLVREAVEAVHGRLDAGNIHVVIQSDLPNIIGDQPRLSEVLQNLIDNAAKYMGNQTEPVIEIGTRGMQEGKQIFFVRDNGMGIAPEYHDRIFELFNKLDTTSEGTGVGLALVRRIIEVHGGHIWVESKIGSGSTFLFTLPVEERIT